MANMRSETLQEERDELLEVWKKEKARRVEAITAFLSNPAMSKLMGQFPSPPNINDPMSTRKWNHEMAQWKSLVWEKVRQSAHVSTSRPAATASGISEACEDLSNVGKKRKACD